MTQRLMYKDDVFAVRITGVDITTYQVAIQLLGVLALASSILGKTLLFCTLI